MAANNPVPPTVFTEACVDPYDLIFVPPTLKLRKVPQKYVMTSLQYLNTEEDHGTTNQPTVLLFLILNCRSAYANNPKNKLRNKFSNGAPKDNAKPGGEKQYDKMICGMCLHSRPGENTFLVLMKSGNDADTLFSLNPTGRDGEGGFCPGAIVAVRKPKHITESFGDEKSGIPILRFHGGFWLVDKAKSGLQLSNTPLTRVNQKMGGFHYPKCHLKLLCFTVQETPCKGYFCDAVDLVRQSANNLKGCSCFAHVQRNNPILFRLELEVTSLSDNYTFQGEYMSRNFTNKITSHKIPYGTSKVDMDRNCLDDVLSAAADELIVQGNKKGWVVAGWFRPGTVQDQGSDPLDLSTVQSSKITPHITFVDYAGNWNELNRFRSNVEALINADKIGGGAKVVRPAVDVPAASLEGEGDQSGRPAGAVPAASLEGEGDQSG